MFLDDTNNCEQLCPNCEDCIPQILLDKDKNISLKCLCSFQEYYTLSEFLELYQSLKEKKLIRYDRQKLIEDIAINQEELKKNVEDAYTFIDVYLHSIKNRYLKYLNQAQITELEDAYEKASVKKQ